MSDRAFLDYVNHAFPVQPCWKLAQPPQELLSNMNSALYTKLLLLESQQNLNKPVTPPG